MMVVLSILCRRGYRGVRISLSTNLVRGLPTVEASSIRPIRRKWRQWKRETASDLLGTYVLLTMNRSELTWLYRGRCQSRPPNSANADGAVWKEHKSIRIQSNTIRDQDEDVRDYLQTFGTIWADLVESLSRGCWSRLTPPSTITPQRKRI